MLKMYEIREMIKLVDQSTLSELEVEAEGVRIHLKKGAAGTVSVPVEQPVAETQPAKPAAVEQTQPAPAPTAEQESKPAEPTPAPATADVEDENLHQITSPMVGTFYKAPEPGADPFVKPGDKVTPDTVVCIVEAMKLFNEIEAEVSGEVVKVLVEDGQLVEYGQPLFLVKPE
ncbi:MAG: acetyl-CoA carboxylase biotin carboxyl carrier protein [Bacillaceae bacterium]|nr:acetyl-CoA carboxylase biotin carboxyl carrier protein [Bacillaceae bacterium]